MGFAYPGVRFIEIKKIYKYIYIFIYMCVTLNAFKICLFIY